MDAMGELQTIIQTSGYSRAKLACLLREMVNENTEKVPRKKREPTSPVSQYTSVKRNYTCLHCEHTFSSIVMLLKGEDTVVITAKGNVMIVNSNSPAEISCVTSSCNWCRDYVKKLTREELEEHYMLLLSMTSLVGKSQRFGKKFTIEGEEIRL